MNRKGGFNLWMALGGLLLAWGFLNTCSRAKAEQPKEGMAEQIRRVATGLVEERDIPDEVYGFGSLSFLQKVDITSPQEGTVEALLRQEGTKVQRGTVLAVLDNPQIRLAVGRAQNAHDQAQAALELARARLLEGRFQAEARIRGLEKSEAELEQARREYKEQERKFQDQMALYEAGGVTEETIRSSRFALESMAERIRLQEQDLAIGWIGLRTVDLQRAGYAVPEDPDALLETRVLLATTTLRAELQAAQAKLEATAKELESAELAQRELTVKSPTSGLIGGRYVETGERLKRDDKIMTLIDTQSLYALFPASEAEAQRIQGGMPAEVRVDGTGGTYRGKVELVSPAADNQSFTFSVRVLLEADAAKKSSLKPGMFARVTVQLGPSRKALVVPGTALVEKRDDQGKLFVVQGGRAVEKEARLGQALGSEWEILEGLEKGAVFIDKPEKSLKDGDHVQALH